MKRHPVVETALLLVALLVSVAAVSAQVDSDPVGLYQQFVEARNQGDVARAVALFTDEGLFQGGECQPCTDKQALQHEVERRVAEHQHTTVTSGQVSETTASVRIEWTSDSVRDLAQQARLEGFKRLVSLVDVEVRGDRLASVSIRLDLTDPQTAAFRRAQQADLVAAPVRAFFDARSRGDATAALELFAEDAVYDGVGLCGGVSGAPPCVGKSAIAPEIERLVSGSRPTVSGTEVSGNVVTVRYEVRGAGPQAAGVERIINVVTAEVQGGKITSFHVGNDTSDPQTATFLAFSRAQAAGASLINAFYAALNAGEADAALALFAEDATWTALTGETVVGRSRSNGGYRTSWRGTSSSNSS